MNLYGNDMDETIVAARIRARLDGRLGAAGPRFHRPRRARRSSSAGGTARKFVGLLLEERGVLRSHQKVIVADVGEGEVTSGTFSPTLERSIGFARVPAADRATAVEVDIRGKLIAARVVQAAVRAQRQGRHRAMTLTTSITASNAGSIEDIMSNVPADLRYTKIPTNGRALENDGTITIGISDHAQQALGDLVFVEVPEAGRHARGGRSLRGRRIGQGGIGRLQPGDRRSGRGQRRPRRRSPNSSISDPYGAGWIMRIRPTTRRSSPRCSMPRRTKPRSRPKRTDQAVVRGRPRVVRACPSFRIPTTMSARCSTRSAAPDIDALFEEIPAGAARARRCRACRRR